MKFVNNNFADFAAFEKTQTDFFVAFNDHSKTNKSINSNKPINNNNHENNDVVDAFGVGINEFNQNGNAKRDKNLNKNLLDKSLDSKFGSLHLGNENGNNSGATSVGFDDDSFADFSTFTAFNSTTNTQAGYSTIGKNRPTPSSAHQLKPIQGSNFEKITAKKEPKDAKSGTIELPQKFSEDYSNAERFDDDLEEVLRRSLVDQ